MKHRLTLLIAAAFLGGCADFGGPINGDAQPVSPEEQRMQDLEAKLAELNRKVDNLNLAAQAQDSQRVEADVRSMRGDVEKLGYQVDSTDKRSRDLYADLDKRLQTLENQSRNTRLTMENNLANAPKAPEASSPEEESTYLQVFDQLKAGHYDDAISGFRGMLEKWPNGRYADNAWYWLGDCYYQKHDYKNAEASFQTLLDNFKDSPKRADAMLELGMTQADMKKKDAAKATLQKVIAEFPKTNAATLARQRLDQLK